jgi:predicted lipoprotein with Yx(FWY)xxD motif
MTMRGGGYLIALAALGAGWPAPAGAQEAALPATPPAITFGRTPIGPVFADAEGYTLYVTRRDTEPGVSTCFGPCASEWPPVRASAWAQPFGNWSLVARGDGTPQWAYRGRPLYGYRQEEQKDWAIGQGNVWQIATVDPFPERGGRRRSYLRAGVRQTRFEVEDAPPGIVAETTPLGVVLADAQGMTLYVAPAACRPACAGMWAPLRAPAAAVPFGDWSVAPRPDGVAQWLYRGRPLYRCTRDAAPGEAACVRDGGRIVEVPPALLVRDGNGG